MTSTDYSGPAVLSLGFRPFFLAAILFGFGAIPAWWLVWTGGLDIGGPFLPADWHVHEMIFGYAAAVIAGFLFTAVPNWTRRMPRRGWPLLALAGLWAAGRVAVAAPGPLPAGAVAAIDTAFLAAIVAVMGVEIVAGRNWRNLMVLGPVVLLTAANVAFHAEVALTGDAAMSRRMGLALVVFLLTLIGGRIVPSFTRNWLAQRGAARLPAPFGRLDGLALMTGAAALLAWTGWPQTPASAVLLAVAGLAHLVRLARWRGAATWKSPLLAMLHLAYAFVPAGLLATSASAAGWLPPAAGIHLLGIGAVGGMTMAVMIRATRGHTGRSLAAGPVLTAAFLLLVAAALFRAIFPGPVIGALDGVALAALAWTAGFGLLAIRLAPWLVAPTVDARRASRMPRQDPSEAR